MQINTKKFADGKELQSLRFTIVAIYKAPTMFWQPYLVLYFYFLSQS